MHLQDIERLTIIIFMHEDLHLVQLNCEGTLLCKIKDRYSARRYLAYQIRLVMRSQDF